MANVAYAPIIGDWLFNAKNAVGDPKNWVTPAVLSRLVVLRQSICTNRRTANRSPSGCRGSSPISADWDTRNSRWVSGSLPAPDAAYPAKSAVQWLNESLGWATANTDKIGVAAYYNAAVNSRDGVYWPLDESAAKIAAFRGWLDDPHVN